MTPPARCQDAPLLRLARLHACQLLLRVPAELGAVRARLRAVVHHQRAHVRGGALRRVRRVLVAPVRRQRLVGRREGLRLLAARRLVRRVRLRAVRVLRLHGGVLLRRLRAARIRLRRAHLRRIRIPARLLALLRALALHVRQVLALEGAQAGGAGVARVGRGHVRARRSIHLLLVRRLLQLRLPHAPRLVRVGAQPLMLQLARQRVHRQALRVRVAAQFGGAQSGFARARCARGMRPRTGRGPARPAPTPAWR
jgi:hypothetical protein